MVIAYSNRNLMKLILSFVVPSLGSQLLSGIYTIVDGFFIGMGAGDAGLAAVGLAFPFTVFVTALGAGIGVGGGTLMSISMGRGRKLLAERILGSMVFLMFCASMVTVIAFTAISKPLLSLYDVSPAVAKMSFIYAWVLLLGSPSQVFTMGMLGAVRNDGFPRKAMFIMILGFVLNIVLDWLWVIVFPFGVAGAAWATVLSQTLTALMLLYHFMYARTRVKLRKCHLHFCLPICRRIIWSGASPFGVQVAAALTMIMHNWQALAYGGEIGVAAYAVIGYIVPVGVMLEEGVAEGIQPLVSYYHGAGLTARRKVTAKMGIWAAIAVGLLCSLFIFLSHTFVPELFSMKGETAKIASRGLLISVPIFPFLGIAKVGASYFQSVGKMNYASALTYSDPFIFLPIFLWILPVFLRLDGVWLAMMLANVVLSIIFLVMWQMESHRNLSAIA